MKIREILSIISGIKQQNKSVVTNYYYSYNTSDCEFDVWQEKGAIVFCIRENDVYRAFFYTNDKNTLIELLKKLPKDTVIDYLSKDEEDQAEWMNEAGFDLYNVLSRMSNGDLKTVPKAQTKREKILEELYDPSFGEFATLDDCDEILSLLYEVFDYRVSRLPSKEELQEMILKNWVLLYRLDNKIISFLIYKIEGKKYYGYQIYNEGTADITYNLERRALQYAIENYGVTSSYAWVEIRNKGANKRVGATADGLLDYIYVKQEDK